MFGVGAFSTCTRFRSAAPSESEPSDSSDDDEPRGVAARGSRLSLGASGLRTTRHTGRREQREHEQARASPAWTSTPRAPRARCGPRAAT